MHLTEGEYNSSNLFVNGPPGTRVEKNWLNAVQKEFKTAIEGAGLTLKTASTETGDQLYAAIVALIASLGGSGFYDAYLKYSDVKAANTDGGTATLGSWETRALNTEDSDDAGIGSLAANRITLPAGTYKVLMKAPCYNVGANIARLQDITGAATLLLGTTEFSDTGGVPSTTSSIIVGQFTLSVSSAIEVQHRVTANKATTGYGISSNLGVNCVYTIAEIWRLT